ncbi:MAG: M48 family metallopeptidase [Bacteroidales bacterium]|nr:M48 family metallopeptidase [Bacteroidales bacterium]
MNKFFKDLVLIIVAFCLIWFLLSKINWVNILRIKRITQKTENKLGDLYWKYLKEAENEVSDIYVIKSIDSVLIRICNKNQINSKDIKIHLLERDEVNAFALPDNHLVIYSGLIYECENEAELCGVICHELAHIQQKHIMKKLVKELGLSALISIASGNAGSEIIKKTVKILSSSAYDREMEREADLASVDYMINADIDPEAFANFLFRLSTEEPDIQRNLYWLSTHPDTEARSKYINEYSRNKSYKKIPVIAISTWNNIKKKLKLND